MSIVLRDDVLSRKFEVDLLRLGVDLLDFYRGKVSARRLIAIATELPQSSLLMRELGRRDVGDSVKWDQKEYLIAAQANAARETAYYTSMLVWAKGGGKGDQPTPPEPIYPPGYQPVQKPLASNREIVSFLRSLGR